MSFTGGTLRPWRWHFWGEHQDASHALERNLDLFALRAALAARLRGHAGLVLWLPLLLSYLTSVASAWILCQSTLWLAMGLLHTIFVPLALIARSVMHRRVSLSQARVSALQDWWHRLSPFFSPQTRVELRARLGEVPCSHQGQGCAKAWLEALFSFPEGGILSVHVHQGRNCPLARQGAGHTGMVLRLQGVSAAKLRALHRRLEETPQRSLVHHITLESPWSLVWSLNLAPENLSPEDTHCALPLWPVQQMLALLGHREPSWQVASDPTLAAFPQERFVEATTQWPLFHTARTAEARIEHVKRFLAPLGRNQDLWPLLGSVALTSLTLAAVLGLRVLEAPDNLLPLFEASVLQLSALGLLGLVGLLWPLLELRAAQRKAWALQMGEITGRGLHVGLKDVGGSLEGLDLTRPFALHVSRERVPDMKKSLQVGVYLTVIQTLEGETRRACVGAFLPWDEGVKALPCKQEQAPHMHREDFVQLWSWLRHMQSMHTQVVAAQVPTRALSLATL